jgi:hypothetical protein
MEDFIDHLREQHAAQLEEVRRQLTEARDSVVSKDGIIKGLKGQLIYYRSNDQEANLARIAQLEQAFKDLRREQSMDASSKSKLEERIYALTRALDESAQT